MADRDRFICCRFSSEEAAALAASARRRGCTMSDLIRLQLLEVITPYIMPFKDPNQTELFQAKK